VTHEDASPLRDTGIERLPVETAAGSTQYPGLLAHRVARGIDELADWLATAPPGQAAQIMHRVLDADEGILGRLSFLLATSSHYAKERAGPQTADLWQELGRASNRLSDLALDLDGHAQQFAELTNPLTPVPPRPPAPPSPARPAPRRGRA
jgi:hypothetical protein